MSSLDGEEVRLLKEILKWTRFSGMREVKAVIDTLVDDQTKRAIYQLSDGSLTTREIGDRVGAGKDKVASLWKIWSRAGLGETQSVKGGGSRFKRSFDLEEFGIEVRIPEATAPSESATTETSNAQNSLGGSQ